MKPGSPRKKPSIKEPDGGGTNGNRPDTGGGII